MKNQKNVVFTDRSDNSINILFKDIRKYPLLKDDEEKELLDRLSKGNMKAREKLINSNLRLVMSMAKQYAWTGMSQGDLFQFGAIGLTEAVNRYDPEKGNCFLAYAIYWIDCELKKAVTEHIKQTHVSLGDKAYPDEDSTCTLADLISAGSEYNADWNIRCEQAIDSMKAKVKSKFFPQAADLWVDYVMMKAQGYALHDIAQKYKLTEEIVKSLIKDINHFLTTH
jgi:RNA polymerase sigma factor (sigma-70 family)